MDNETIKLQNQVKQKITMWLTDENLFEKKIPSQKRLIFGFVFHFPANAKNAFTIILQDNIPDSVIISRGITISPEHTQIIKEWSTEKRNSFMVEFLMNLHKFNIEFNLTFKKETLIRFGVSQRLFIKTLTKEKFWNAVITLNNASQFAIFQIQQKTNTFTLELPPLSKDRKDGIPEMYG